MFSFSSKRSERGTVEEIASALARERGDDHERCLQKLLSSIAAGDFPAEAVTLLPTEHSIFDSLRLGYKGPPRGVPLSRVEARRIVLEKPDANRRLMIEAAALHEWREANTGAKRSVAPAKGNVGRPRKVDTACQVLRARFPDGPKSLPSHKKLRGIIEHDPLNNYGQTISEDTLGRALRELGWR